ncbi:MAG: aldolase/citrate lyase family protein [Opitutales bacterium]|nr:aldolase/citrate lyase family protein [Opitutales bacterium]
MANTGFDFVTIDAEHSAVDLTDAQPIFQAIRAGNTNTEAFVRLHGVDYALTKRYLDAGATGIIAPLVLNAEEARLLVRACKYPPMGKRGVGFCRANKYGMDVEEHYSSANEEILLAVQIEDIEAVAHIDDILSVEGIDAAFLGPYDLSASMGITGDFEHPDFIAARNEILASCKRNGVTPGIHVVQPNPKQAIDRIHDGFHLLAYSLDITMILNTCLDGLSKIRAGLTDK